MSKRPADYEQKTTISFNHKNPALFVSGNYVISQPVPNIITSNQRQFSSSYLKRNRKQGYGEAMDEVLTGPGKRVPPY